MGCTESTPSPERERKEKREQKKQVDGVTKVEVVTSTPGGPDAGTHATPQRPGTHPETGAPLEYASSCWLPQEWTPVVYKSSEEHTHDTKIYAFALPEGVSLSLPTCSCILVRTPDGEGARPYTPISSNKEKGQFRLMIKRYEQGPGPHGVVSSYINALRGGEQVYFKHIGFNIKEPHPFRRKKLSLIAGGSGITPVYQALQAIVEADGDMTEAVVLFGNKTVKDILLRQELDAFAVQSQGRIKVHHILSNAEPGTWDGDTGFIDESKISKYCFPPGDDTLIMVCGVPIMYDILCGPRTEKVVKEGTVLHKMGYTEDMVVKF